MTSCFQNASAYLQKIILSPIPQTLSFPRPSKRALLDNCLLSNTETPNELGDAPGVECESVFKLKRPHYCDGVVLNHNKFKSAFHSNSASNNYDFSGGIVPPTGVAAPPCRVPIDSLIQTKADSSPDIFSCSSNAMLKASCHAPLSEHVVNKSFQKISSGDVAMELSVRAISLQMTPLSQIDVGSATLKECDKSVALLQSFQTCHVQQVSMRQMMKNAALTDTKKNRAIVNSLVDDGRLLVKGRSRSTRYQLAAGN